MNFDSAKINSLTAKLISDLKTIGFDLYNEIDEEYADFESESTYKECEENYSKRCTFNLMFTINFSEYNHYVVFGRNIGDGFDDILQMTNDGSCFKEQIQVSLKTLKDKQNKTKFETRELEVIDNHEEEFNEILEIAKSLTNYVKNSKLAYVTVN